VKVCLATGFERHTQNMLLESLGWMGLADRSLCPDDAGRGRPYPYMILTAVLALDLDDVREVAVVGETEPCGIAVNTLASYSSSVSQDAGTSEMSTLALRSSFRAVSSVTTGWPTRVPAVLAAPAPRASSEAIKPNPR
jgi:hypothetical protein